MKTTVQILAVYLLLLSLIPCGDGGGGLIEIVNHVFDIEHQVHSDHEQHSGSCTDDFCSPFCVCSCCSITLNFPNEAALNFREYNPSPTTKPSFIPHEVTTVYPSSIWQPPRLS